MKYNKKNNFKQTFMFKKIEIWIFYLVVLLGIPITILFGSLVRHELLGGTKLGRISKSALFLAEIPKNINEILLNRDDLEVEERFPLLNGFNGAPNLNKSYILLSRYDGELKEGIVELVDLTNFKVLHTWNPDIDDLNKSLKKSNEFKYLNRDNNNSRMVLRHPILLNDGGLVFQNHTPLIKIDNCSDLIFQNNHDVFHHSLEKDFEGNLWVPSHMYPQSLHIEKVGRDIKEDSGFIDDAIVKLSADGEILYEKSVSQIFIDNGLEYLLFATGNPKFLKDPIHLNDIQPVDFDGEFWKKGDLFLSVRNQSMILLFRPSTNTIIWKGTGPFFNQHDVDILNNQTISVFNNNAKSFVNEIGFTVDGHNEIVTYNFKTNKYSTYQSESLIKNDVKTSTQGRSQILPNGDLFVEETIYGRSLYFNSDGSLRWTHLNRAQNGKVYYVGWSRVLYNDADIKLVNNFLQSRGKCND